ncbi:MAG: hypothetical protein Q4A54_00570 [Parabacteroides sp.]|nr:hypothetical protein [Parabacteroides sp.]
MKSDKTIERLQRIRQFYLDTIKDDTAVEAVDMAIKAVEKQEADRWTPVTERPPKEDGEYLVTYESGYAEDYGFDPIGIAPFEVDCEGFGIWQESFDPVSLGSLGSEWVDIPVTAWRPLPEPYTEEES